MEDGDQRHARVLTNYSTLSAKADLQDGLGEKCAILRLPTQVVSITALCQRKVHIADVVMFIQIVFLCGRLS